MKIALHTIAFTTFVSVAFQLSKGGAKGPFTLLLSAVFIGLAVVCAVVATFLPSEPRRPRQTSGVRLAAGLIVLALLLAFPCVFLARDYLVLQR